MPTEDSSKDDVSTARHDIACAFHDGWFAEEGCLCDAECEGCEDEGPDFDPEAGLTGEEYYG